MYFGISRATVCKWRWWGHI